MTLTKCYAGPGRRSFDHVYCDSLQRLRTPDHLPMDHSTAQARQQALQQRHRRLTTSNNVRKACIDSDNLRQYSRRRFEFAVQNATTRIERDRDLDIPRPYTTPNISCHNTAWTGPTSQGSLLYNRIPLMLNSIRVRPQSESVKYSHSSRTYPDIDTTLRRSNNVFTVRTTPGSRGHFMTSRSRGVTSRCSSLDYMLIPVVNHPSEDLGEILAADNDEEGEELYTDSSSWLPRPQVVLELSGPGARDRYHIDNMSESSSETRTSASKSSKNIKNIVSPVPKSPVIRPSYDEARSETRNRLAVTKVPRIPSAGRKTGSDQSTSGSMSSGSTRSERPRCWVDDVTISSELSEEENVEVKSSIADDSKQRPGIVDRGKQKSRLESRQVRVEDKLENKQTKVDDKLESKQVRIDDIVIADDNIEPDDNQNEAEDEGQTKADFDSEPEYVFPKFLCPSSERKSRQAAIKLWLARTCFTCADKNVPLF